MEPGFGAVQEQQGELKETVPSLGHFRDSQRAEMHRHARVGNLVTSWAANGLSIEP